jgi:hypothetical protein
MVHIRTPWVFQDIVNELDRWARNPSWAFGGLESGSLSGNGGFHVEEGVATLTLELPGVEESDLDILIENDRLRLTAKRHDQGTEREDVLLRERTYGEFGREYRLPWPVDESAGRATLEKGVLTLVLHRAEEAAPRTIEVRSV